MTKTPAERIGANVRAEMARIGMAQSALADALGISQPAVSSRLRGKTAFDVDELQRVADALGVGVADLYADRPTAAAS